MTARILIFPTYTPKPLEVVWCPDFGCFMPKDHGSPTWAARLARRIVRLVSGRAK